MPSPPSFRRLVIALGTSRDSLARLETWTDLAFRLRAEISGLFVDDADLLRMAGLPFARVVGFDSVSRSFDAPTLERLLRRAASEARTALEAHATRRAIGCSFQRVRGGDVAQLVAAVAADDLVVVEGAVLGRAARTALHRCHASLLYLRPQAPSGRAVIVRAAGADDGPLAAAGHLAAATGRTLSVLVEGGEEERARAAQAIVRMVPAGVPVRVDALHGDGARVAEILRAEPGAIFVSASDEVLPADDEAGRALDELPCSVLIVRTGAAAIAPPPGES